MSISDAALNTHSLISSSSLPAVGKVVDSCLDNKRAWVVYDVGCRGWISVSVIELVNVSVTLSRKFISIEGGWGSRRAVGNSGIRDEMALDKRALE